ncbi:hypothetical protein AVEN_221358-1 [Araneus ventricosus]|uniref:Uncharacterized protein n=1 Tax=Araneus ventricosus TaxID=182803 RepID=A0A4Y2B139_ARAVE|nr:hypothetical protein AVEN_221358-1 [Araneus ventricosus]
MTRTTPQPPSLNYTTTPQREDFRSSMSNLTCYRPIYTKEVRWNRVSNLEPSCPESKALPTDHRDPGSSGELKKKKTLENYALSVTPKYFSIEV